MMPDWYNNCCLQPAVADTQSGQWRVAPILSGLQMVINQCTGEEQVL